MSFIPKIVTKRVETSRNSLQKGRERSGQGFFFSSLSVPFGDVDGFLFIGLNNLVGLVARFAAGNVNEPGNNLKPDVDRETCRRFLLVPLLFFFFTEKEIKIMFVSLSYIRRPSLRRRRTSEAPRCPLPDIRDVEMT